MAFKDIREKRLSKTEKLLNQVKEIIDEYAEEIAKLNIEILEQDKIDWFNYIEEYLDIIYNALEEVYSITLDFIRDVYNIEPIDEEITENDINNLTYKKDGLNLKQRILNHFNDYKENKPNKERLLYDFMQILNTEAMCVNNNLIKNKIKEEFEYGIIEDSNCCEVCSEYVSAGPIILDDIEEPPYHPNCECFITYYSSSEIED